MNAWGSVTPIYNDILKYCTFYFKTWTLIIVSFYIKGCSPQPHGVMCSVQYSKDCCEHYSSSGFVCVDLVTFRLCTLHSWYTIFKQLLNAGVIEHFNNYIVKYSYMHFRNFFIEVVVKAIKVIY